MNRNRKLRYLFAGGMLGCLVSGIAAFNMGHEGTASFFAGSAWVLITMIAATYVKA